jgi:hypothetical protein
MSVIISIKQLTNKLSAIVKISVIPQNCTSKNKKNVAHVDKYISVIIQNHVSENVHLFETFDK